MTAPTPLADVFAAPLNEAVATLVDHLPEPQTRYLLAMTPRSGSTYLCDVLGRTGRLGAPREFLSEGFIRRHMAELAPSADADAYLGRILRATRSPNGVAGFKASWFQFELFEAAMHTPEPLHRLRFIYLTRRDLAAQAVSLYCATATEVFHGHVKHAPAKLHKLAALPYDFARIDEWRRHIQAQEQGWRRFFDTHGLHPLAITYEEIEEDVCAVVRRIARYLGRPQAGNNARPESAHRKLGERRNLEWACRYTLERDALARATPTPLETAPCP